MLTLLKERTKTKPGGIIELHSTQVPVGTVVEVSAIVEFQPSPPPRLVTMIGKGKGLYRGAQDADEQLRSQRGEWERRVPDQRPEDHRGEHFGAACHSP